MVQAIRCLDELIGKGCHVGARCLGCGRERFFTPYELVCLFRARGWQTGWREAPARFRCSTCGSKPARLSLRFLDMDPTRETVRAGLRQPPPGISVTAWNRASESERKRLVDRARS